MAEFKVVPRHLSGGTEDTVYDVDVLNGIWTAQLLKGVTKRTCSFRTARMKFEQIENTTRSANRFSLHSKKNIEMVYCS